MRRVLLPQKKVTLAGNERLAIYDISPNLLLQAKTYPSDAGICDATYICTLLSHHSVVSKDKYYDPNSSESMFR